MTDRQYKKHIKIIQKIFSKPKTPQKTYHKQLFKMNKINTSQGIKENDTDWEDWNKECEI